MPKTDQSVRVVLCRNGDGRSVLGIWRIGDDYYSTVPGQPGHRAYHEHGRVHTKTGEDPKTGKGEYTDVAYKAPSASITELESLDYVVMRNESDWHGEKSPLKRYKGRKVDLLVRIDAADVPEGRLLAISVGMTNDATAINQYIDATCAGGGLALFRREILTRTDGPSMFVSVVVATLDEEELPAKDVVSRMPGAQFVPQPGRALRVAGGRVRDRAVATLFAANGGFGVAPAPQPLPETPIRVEDWMKRYRVTLAISPIDDCCAVVNDDLWILGFRSNSGTSQRILVHPTMFCDIAQNVPNRGSKNAGLRLGPIESTLVLEFGYGRPGGVLKQQFNMDNVNYQMEMVGVHLVKVDKLGNKVQQGNTQSDTLWRMYCDLEVVRLTP